MGSEEVGDRVPEGCWNIQAMQPVSPCDSFTGSGAASEQVSQQQ